MSLSLPVVLVAAIVIFCLLLTINVLLLWSEARRRQRLARSGKHVVVAVTYASDWNPVEDEEIRAILERMAEEGHEGDRDE